MPAVFSEIIMPVLKACIVTIIEPDLQDGNSPQAIEYRFSSRIDVRVNEALTLWIT